MSNEMTLVIPGSVSKWDAIYASGSDKKYPNLDLVRLEQWFFKRKPGRFLEYAFGCGENLLHLLECGYTVDALDASVEAKKTAERKFAHRPELAARATLIHLPPESTRLPYEDGRFDFVNCLSVLSLLGSPERIQYLLREFARVMKPGAKIIVDINGPHSDFAHYAKPLGNDIYETRGHGGSDLPHLSYCPKDKDSFIALVKPIFEIDDVGYSAHKYFHSEIEEFIICAHKKS